MKNYNYINKSNNQIKKSNSFSSIKKDNNYNLNLTFTEFPKNNNFLINQSFINNNKKFNSTLTEWRNNPIKINNNNTNEKNNNIKSQQITPNGKNHFISSVPPARSMSNIQSATVRSISVTFTPGIWAGDVTPDAIFELQNP